MLLANEVGGSPTEVVVVSSSVAAAQSEVPLAARNRTVSMPNRRIGISLVSHEFNLVRHTKTPSDTLGRL